MYQGLIGPKKEDLIEYLAWAGKRLVERRKRPIKRRIWRRSASIERDQQSYRREINQLYSFQNKPAKTRNDQNHETLKHKKLKVHATIDNEEVRSESEEFGPQPLTRVKGVVADMEEDAMLSYIHAGKRIPRRGEVGLSSENIEIYEKSGYVLSGTRHKKMNEYNITRENQVYSAEEQRALMLYNYEERVNREAQLISDLKELLSKRTYQNILGKQKEQK